MLPAPLPLLQYGAQLVLARGEGPSVASLLGEALLQHCPADMAVLCNGAAALGMLCLLEHRQLERQLWEGGRQQQHSGAEGSAASGEVGGKSEEVQMGPILEGEPLRLCIQWL